VHGVTGQQWRLARQIEAILASESGMSVADLSDRSDSTVADVRAVVRALYAMKRADFCHGYVTAAPLAVRGRLAS
jgi:hypothetical protein